ncbi:unnamed protein product [Paramecium octaurelia]|uniref:Uncharacterized protein n=1 Tax=Paramecium octaurelia TaxID=43137 RepID=A0A8S1SLV4_PAROT|nr:unnamed protein product [Paramecium octaurelia]
MNTTQRNLIKIILGEQSKIRSNSNRQDNQQFEYQTILKEFQLCQACVQEPKIKHQAYRDRLWRLLNKNGQTIILELINKNSQIKKRQYHIDKQWMISLNKRNKNVKQYAQNYIQEKNKKKKVLDFSLSMMQPEMFTAPTYEDLVEIYKIYAIQNKIAINDSHN